MPDHFVQTPTIRGSQVIYPTPDDAAPDGRYKLNLILLCLATILVSVWFVLHLQTLVSQVLVVGGTLTVWGLWKLIEQAIAIDRKDFTKRLLAHRNATQYLVFVTVVFAVAMFFTSSFYVQYGPGAGASSVTLRVDEERKNGDSIELVPLMSEQKLSSIRPIVGRILRPHIFSRTLVFTVIHPPGKQPLRQKFSSFTPLHLTLFDERFSNATYKIMRLVPGSTMQFATDAAEKSGWTVQIRRGDEPIYRIDDAHVRTYYFGAPERDLRTLVPREDPAYAARLERYLATRDMTAEDRSTIREASLLPPVIGKSNDVHEGEELVAVVQYEGEIPMECTFRVGAAPLQTCFMEVSGEDQLSVVCE